MSSNALYCFMSIKYTFNLKECQCLSRKASYFFIAFIFPPFQLSRILLGVHVIWRRCLGIILTEVWSINARFQLCSRLYWTLRHGHKNLPTRKSLSKGEGGTYRYKSICVLRYTKSFTANSSPSLKFPR